MAFYLWKGVAINDLLVCEWNEFCWQCLEYRKDLNDERICSECANQEYNYFDNVVRTYET